MSDPIIQIQPSTPESLGQKTSDKSFPVVLPSDYTISVDPAGLATETKQDAIIAAVDGVEASLTSVDNKLDSVATESTQEKLREWPYANHDNISVVWTVGTLTEVFTYLSGVTPVGTITIVYGDSGKEQISTIVYSPQKVV